MNTQSESAAVKAIAAGVQSETSRGYDDMLETLTVRLKTIHSLKSELCVACARLVPDRPPERECLVLVAYVADVRWRRLGSCRCGVRYSCLRAIEERNDVLDERLALLRAWGGGTNVGIVVCHSVSTENARWLFMAFETLLSFTEVDVDMTMFTGRARCSEEVLKFNMDKAHRMTPALLWLYNVYYDAEMYVVNDDGLGDYEGDDGLGDFEGDYEDH